MMSDAFVLDPRLADDGESLGDLPLCRAILVDDARFPWIILVPRKPDLVELQNLAPDDRVVLMGEIDRASAAVRALAAPARPVEKLNIAALGNVVRQLHVHVVGRRADDPGWPKPVWGAGAREPHAPEMLAILAGRARAALGL